MRVSVENRTSDSEIPDISVTIAGQKSVLGVGWYGCAFSGHKGRRGLPVISSPWKLRRCRKRLYLSVSVPKS